MSKQDSQFFNMFSAVLGILIVVALLLFGLARAVGINTQVEDVRTDPRYVAEVEERIRPFVRVAVAGQDNSGLVIAGSTGAPAPETAVVMPTDGPSLYAVACTACHTEGIGGAPKSGDKAAWAPRIAQGTATLYKHSLEGFQGKGGVMPAKGGRTDVSDELVKAAVDHMVELNR